MKRKNSTATLYAWLMWFIASLFYALDYFQHTAPSVLISPIATSLKIPVTTVGNVMSVYFPVYALTQIPAGYLLDKFNIRYVLTLACLVVSFGLYFTVFPSISAILFGRILIAIGSAFAFLGAIKTASLWLSDKIFPLAVGLTNTFGVLGGLLGQPILNELILRYHWQHAIKLIIGCGLLISLLIFLALQAPKQYIIKKRSTLSFRYIFKTKSLWFIAFYAGIMVGTVVNALAELYGVIFLQQTNGISSEAASIINSMAFVGIAVGGPLHGFIARQFQNKRHWMLIANAITTGLFSLLAFVPIFTFPAWSLYLLYFLIGFFVSSMLLSFGIIRSHYPKENHASIFAFINMIIALCGAFFQLVFGNELALVKPLFSHGAQNITFSIGILILIVPLLFSWYCCNKIKKAIFLLPV